MKSTAKNIKEDLSANICVFNQLVWIASWGVNVSAFFSYFRFSPKKTGSHDWIILKKDVTLEAEIGKGKKQIFFLWVCFWRALYIRWLKYSRHWLHSICAHPIPCFYGSIMTALNFREINRVDFLHFVCFLPSFAARVYSDKINLPQNCDTSHI